MAFFFFDTSALVKYYHRETGTQQVMALIGEPSNRIFISRLGLVEWHSAFALKVRMGVLSRENYQIAKSAYYGDIRVRKIVTLPLARTHQQQAVRLLKKYAFSHNLRTLDALQLAVAIDLNQKTPLDHFVCSDIPFCQIVRQEGLSVFNPEEADSPP